MLHVHRAPRADGLVSALAEVLAEPLRDVMAREVIAVPAKGVERWLMQRLSHHLGTSPDQADGVCANVEFPTPSRLVAQALATVTHHAPDDDPWRSQALAWSLLEVIDGCGSEPWCLALGRYLGLDAAGQNADTDRRRRRRLAIAMHLAKLFDEYAANRPAMLTDWHAGSDTDGAGRPLPDDLIWQAELWRRLRAAIGVASPAERLQPALEALAKDPLAVDLPDRLSLFGPTRLTASQLAVVAALAEHRDVNLWISHPSAALWDKVAALDLDHTAEVRRRSADPSFDVPANPLLASLGRDVRELQLRLAGIPHVDHLYDVPTSGNGLLGRLQHSIAIDEPPDVDFGQRLQADATDVSVQVHACHGRARQVEVLREVLVGLLAADHTLEPRDIIVMCPDVETYAPLISATFGIDDDDPDRHPGHRLRVRLADRSQRQTNPLLSTLAKLLDLAGGRVTASEVLDLAASPVVRDRFKFDDDDLERLHGWVAAANIRWGLDAEHRAPWSLEALPQNTWRTGLDRILLGVAMSEDELRYIATCLPLDDVDSNDIDLAGRFAELLDRLGAVVDAMHREQALDAWVTALRDGLESLTAVRDRDSWQWSQVHAKLSELAAAASSSLSSSDLSVTDIVSLLADDLAGRPTRANFRTGGLTVCSMVPMRSVPHRVVCLLGLDDGAFPRNSAVDGDNVLARDSCIGERDARSEDRQLLLDAVMAAKETLVVVYNGADPRSNARRPPAVPVGELLDALDRIATTGDAEEGILDRVIVRHPLQPFDARNFTPDLLAPQRPFSFDRHALAAAEVAAGERTEPDVLVPVALPSLSAGDVELTQLVYFLEQPVKAFLRQRLDVTVLGDEDEIADAMAVQLDNLQRWAIGDHLLHARLRGISAEDARAAEWRRGSLPPNHLGQAELIAVQPVVEALVAAAVKFFAEEPHQIDVDASLAPMLLGRSVTGTVGGIRGDRIVRVEYSSLAPKHRLRAWAQLLALTVARPDRQWTAVTIGRARDDATLSTLGPIDVTDARAHLAGLVTLRDHGLCEPLPMAVKTSHAYATARRAGDDLEEAIVKAEKEWVDGRNFSTGETINKEQSDLAHQLAWNGIVDLDALLDHPAGAVAVTPGSVSEPHRFGALARLLWEPLLDHERLGS